MRFPAIRRGSRATGRINSPDVFLHRGGSTDISRGGVDYSTYQPMDEVEEETHPPIDSRSQSDAVSQLDRVTCELCETDLIGSVFVAAFVDSVSPSDSPEYISSRS